MHYFSLNQLLFDIVLNVQWYIYSSPGFLTAFQKDQNSFKTIVIIFSIIELLLWENTVNLMGNNISIPQYNQNRLILFGFTLVITSIFILVGLSGYMNSLMVKTQTIWGKAFQPSEELFQVFIKGAMYDLALHLLLAHCKN